MKLLIKTCILLIVIAVAVSFCGKKEQQKNNVDTTVKSGMQKPDAGKNNQVAQRPKKPVRKESQVEKPDLTDYGVPEYPGSSVIADSSKQSYRNLTRKGSSKSVVVYTYDRYEDVCAFYKEELKQYNPHTVTIPTSKGQQQLITFEKDGKAVTMMILNDEEENYVRIHYSTKGDE